MKSLLSQVIALTMVVRSRPALPPQAQTRQSLSAGIPETTSGCNCSGQVIDEVQNRARRLAAALPPLHP